MTTSAQPDEFAASGGSPPTPATLADHLVNELAQILADALHDDLKQYPNLEDIPPLPELTVVSRRGSARRPKSSGPNVAAAIGHCRPPTRR